MIGCHWHRTPLSGISWSHAGYHSDRQAFYTIADGLRLYSADRIIKLSNRYNSAAGLVSMPESYATLGKIVR